MPGSDKTAKSAKPAQAAPHYLGHRERLRERFLQGGSDALQDYEMLELILFRAIPRRDVKPLAKELLKKFGSLAEVIAAPVERLKGRRLGGFHHHRPQDPARGRQGAPGRRGPEAASALVMVERARLLP